MSDTFWAGVVLLSLGGVFFWGWLFAQILFFLLKATSRKQILNPLTSPGVLIKNTNQAKGNGAKTNYTSRPKKYICYFQKICCRCKDILIRGSFRQCRQYPKNINHYRDNTNTRTDDKTTNIVNQPVNCKLKESPQHSNTNVSQGEKTCQPKGNDTT